MTKTTITKNELTEIRKLSFAALRASQGMIRLLTKFNFKILQNQNEKILNDLIEMIADLEAIKGSISKSIKSNSKLSSTKQQNEFRNTNSKSLFENN